MSQTFKTLHGLVDKGVKVDLGIPLELWDNPPVEVTQMKSQCENMLEEYEDVISDWYFKKQDEKDLIVYLCAEQVLAANDRKCLKEEFSSSEQQDAEAKNKKTKKKNKKAQGDNEEL